MKTKVSPIKDLIEKRNGRARKRNSTSVCGVDEILELS